MRKGSAPAKRTPEEKSSPLHNALTVVGTILCIILIPILIINVTLIVKSYTNKEAVPDVGGWFPLIVLTESMEPEIKAGDIIVCHTTDSEEIEVGDVISFFDPAGNGTSIVTHRVIEVLNEGGAPQFRTRGDNNNTDDKLPVDAEDLVGVYRSRIPGAGHVAMFMQTTTGLIVCVVLPILLLVGYDIVRRRIYERNKQDDTDALLAELEALRAEKAAKAAASAEDEQ